MPEANPIYQAIYLRIITGALLLLTEADNWEQVNETDQTVEETIEVFARVFDSFLRGYPVRPTGAVMAYAGGPLVPPGWLECDGAEVSQAVYPLLYGVIGSLYGAAAEGYFRLPDLRGRVVVSAGAGDGLSNRDLTETGGEEAHTLVTGEMPSHQHNVGITTSKAGTGASIFVIGAAYNAGSTNTGGDAPHNNMPPFIVLKHIIFTGSYPYD